jgi:hemolysin type calcium-binding protein
MIDCGSVCSVFLEPGARLTLSAAPAAGETFVAWTDCPLSDGARCTIDVAGSICVIASFSGNAPPVPTCGSAPGSPPPLGSPPPPPADHPPLGTACTIRGSARADVIRGTPDSDVICGGGGRDRLYGGAGHDLILGGKGNDRLYGGPGREHLLGGPGDDVLVGGLDDDELFGDTGADLLLARDGLADFVLGGRGPDRARVDRMDLVRSVERRLH